MKTAFSRPNCVKYYFYPEDRRLRSGSTTRRKSNKRLLFHPLRHRCSRCWLRTRFSNYIDVCYCLDIPAINFPYHHKRSNGTICLHYYYCYHQNADFHYFYYKSYFWRILNYQTASIHVVWQMTIFPRNSPNFKSLCCKTCRLPFDVKGRKNEPKSLELGLELYAGCLKNYNSKT